jgi:hypothetical protein
MRESVFGTLFIILFGIVILAISIIVVIISPYQVPEVPVEECAKHLGKTFCDLLYGL